VLDLTPFRYSIGGYSRIPLLYNVVQIFLNVSVRYLHYRTVPHYLIAIYCAFGVRLSSARVQYGRCYHCSAVNAAFQQTNSGAECGSQQYVTREMPMIFLTATRRRMLHVVVVSHIKRTLQIRGGAFKQKNNRD